jgi:hypothetical protein
MLWMNQLDERQQKEIAFCVVYAMQFAHGSSDHNRMILIARLAAMLDDCEIQQDKQRKSNEHV